MCSQVASLNRRIHRNERDSPDAHYPASMQHFASWDHVSWQLENTTHHNKRNRMNRIRFPNQNQVVHYLDIIRKYDEGDRIIAVSRVSTPQQSHLPYEWVLRRAIFELVPLVSFVSYTFNFVPYTFTGCAKLTVSNMGKPNGYYADLEKTLWVELQKTPPDKKLYVIYPTRTRIARPALHGAWDYSVDDGIAFDSWMGKFGLRQSDIIFAVLHTGTMLDDRIYESALGTEYQNTIKAIWNTKAGRLGRQASRKLKPVALSLREQGCSVSDIIRHFEREYPNERTPAPKTIRDWVKGMRLPKPPKTPTIQSRR